MITRKQVLGFAMAFAAVVGAMLALAAGNSVASAAGNGATVSPFICTSFGGFLLPDGNLSGVVNNAPGLLVENSNGTDLTCKGNVTEETDDRTLTVVAADSSHPIKGNAVPVQPVNAGAPCGNTDIGFTFDFTIHYSAGGTAMPLYVPGARPATL